MVLCVDRTSVKYKIDARVEISKSSLPQSFRLEYNEPLPARKKVNFKEGTLEEELPSPKPRQIGLVSRESKISLLF